MTVTIRDEESDFEINIGPSDAQPGKFTVTIFASSAEHVERAIVALARDFDNVVFTSPVRCSREPGVQPKYGAMGRVWKEKSHVVERNGTEEVQALAQQAEASLRQG